ncbi:hypothetical protein CHL79_25330 [Delftia acidovorans]|jgi:hypothetical protein|uniref:DUF3275 family protein n=1 Tax=Delftia acidovorans TaxID=80866 RepID=UPI000BC32048|nr:DUF3275 family protein [Delftia acidovorans]ATH16493.1 hypothetical protein CHL79_25330 [Delftia acidovorans]
MIKLSGITLRVKKIRGGRNGDFCVGELFTDIGEFRVFDQLLDQFDDGVYRGTAWVERIFLKQYIHFNKSITEIRAVLHDLQIDDMEERPAEPHLVEADPADEEPRAAPPPPLPPRAAPVSTTSTLSPGSSPAQSKSRANVEELKKRIQKRLARGEQAPAAASASDAVPAEDPQSAQEAQLQELFGELWPQVNSRDAVKLDPTVDRLRLRQQVAALKDLGYRMADIQSQTWHPI